MPATALLDPPPQQAPEQPPQQPPKNRWKALLKWMAISSGVTLLVLGLVIGGVIWFWNDSKSLAQEIYGRPLPKNVFPLVAWQNDSLQMSVMTDHSDDLIMVLIHPRFPEATVSPLDSMNDQVNRLLDRMPLDPYFRSYLEEAVNNGEPMLILVNGRLVPILKNKPAQGFSSAVGILARGEGDDKLYFIAINPIGEVSAMQIRFFLTAMEGL